jgi:hypothetical protein
MKDLREVKKLTTHTLGGLLQCTQFSRATERLPFLKTTRQASIIFIKFELTFFSSLSVFGKFIMSS